MAEIDIYRAILKEAQVAGLLEQLPDSDEEIEKEGQFFLAEARKAAMDGRKDKVIKAIQNLGDELGKQTVETIFGDDKQLWKGLPVPEDPIGEYTPLPLDFTDLGDKQLRKLHGEYNSYLRRARWNLSVTINRLSAATNLRDEVYRSLYKKFATELSLKGERATKDLIDSFVKEDDEYKSKDTLVRKHQDDVTNYKALVEIYSGDIDRLSRDWTMRIDEDKRAY